jgi:hypothetical protein
MSDREDGRPDRELGEVLRCTVEPPMARDDLVTRLEAGIEEIDREEQLPVRPHHWFGGWTRRRTGLASAAALAAAVVAALTLFGLPRNEHRGGPAPALAAEVARRMAMAASTATTLRAAYEMTAASSSETYTQQGTIVCDSSGNYRDDSTLIAATTGAGVPESDRPVRTVSVHAGPACEDLVVSYWRGKNGSQDVSYMRWSSSDGLGEYHCYASLVRAALADSAPGIAVTSTTYAGRPAWEATIPIVVSIPSEGSPTAVSPARAGVHAIVDQQTGFAVVTRVTTPVVTVEYRLSDLRIDEPLAPELFSTDPPRGDNARLDNVDDGTYRLSTPAAAERSMGAPLPSVGWLPDGYRQTSVAAVWDGDTNSENGGQVTFGEGAWVAEVVYRRGLDTITMCVLPGPPNGIFWARFFASTEEIRSSDTSVRAVTISDGLFAGAQGHTALGSLGGIPWLAVSNHAYSVVITGEASRDELEAIAESLTVEGR